MRRIGSPFSLTNNNSDPSGVYCSMCRARTSLLNGARDAGYLDQIHGGQAEKYAVTWKLTDVGVLKLAPSDEETESAIGTLFPPMNPEPLDRQLALPSPKENDDA